VCVMSVRCACAVHVTHVCAVLHVVVLLVLCAAVYYTHQLPCVVDWRAVLHEKVVHLTLNTVFQHILHSDSGACMRACDECM
jgi:hypothetical protein